MLRPSQYGLGRGCAAQPALAYYISEFPMLSTTFIQREVRALRRLGLEMALVANNCPGSNGFQLEDRDFIKETEYLKPVRPLRYLRANGSLFFQRPGPYVKAMREALALGMGNSSQLIQNLGWVAGCGVLAEFVRRRGIRHLHVHFAFGAAGLAMFLKKVTGIPYSLSIHGSDVLLPRPLLREKIAGARFVISNCQYHLDHLTRQYPELTRQRFFLVRLGIELHQGIWATPSPIPHDRVLRILHVARLHPVKGQDRLIKALALLRDRGISFTCRIVGGGTEKEKLIRLIQDLGLSHQVHLLGPGQEDEVARQFHWCHVFVLSSLSEGTPATIIEAMAMARPVVAPRITALPEMVVHGETGFLCAPDSVADLADRLATFAGQQNLMNRMGREGRKRAETLFDGTVNTALLQKIFQDELGFLPG